jgi:hypothetical protein
VQSQTESRDLPSLREKRAPLSPPQVILIFSIHHCSVLSLSFKSIKHNVNELIYSEFLDSIRFLSRPENQSEFLEPRFRG